MQKSEILATHKDNQSYYLDWVTKTERSPTDNIQTTQISSKNPNY